MFEFPPDTSSVNEAQSYVASCRLDGGGESGPRPRSGSDSNRLRFKECVVVISADVVPVGLKCIGQSIFSPKLDLFQRGTLATKCKIEKNLSDESISNLPCNGVVNVFDETAKSLLGCNVAQSFADRAARARSTGKVTIENASKFVDGRR